MASVSDSLRADIKEFVYKGIDLSSSGVNASPDPFWQSLTDAGTELWLDTGDIEEAAKNWSAEMKALTTNNSLLNKEIQKGIYDDLIKEAEGILGELTTDEKVLEIAFILNAHHGLKLVENFKGFVSVELHTDLAHDLERTIEYGQRFHEICPDNFIVKVPLTAEGILGARALCDEGIRINYTLEFSARQNAVVAYGAKPDYVNVFLGRINGYISSNGLGDGNMAGEKTTLASQKALKTIAEETGKRTRQIAASLRSGEQVASLAGVDVYTMPTKVAADAKETLDGLFLSNIDEEYEVILAEGVDSVASSVNKFWDITDEVLAFAQSLDSDTPSSGAELSARAADMGAADMFPALSEDDWAQIASDGKIPVHAEWADRIEKGELAADTLLNLAGLMAFTADQADLDNRIRGIIS